MSSVTRVKAVTIRDVAQEAGVSISTVSRAFARPGRVSAATARHIREVADRLGYRADPVTTQAPIDRQGLNGILAITVADISNPVFSDYVKSAQHQCLRKGFGLLVIDSEETGVIERGTLGLVRDHVDGLILASSRASDTAIRKMAEVKPVITLNRPVRGLPSIIADATTGLTQAVAHLAGLGHRSLTYLSGPAASWQDGMRWRALTAQCERHAMLLKRVPCPSPTYAGGFAAATRFLDNPTSCVVAYNDNIAIGFIAALRERGVAVPADVSVIGIDDVPVCALISPALSSVRLPRRQLGEQAVEQMVGRLHHTIANPSLEPVTFPSAFTKRASCGPAK